MICTPVIQGSIPVGKIVVGGEFLSPKELIRAFLASGPGPARDRRKEVFSSWEELLLLPQKELRPFLVEKKKEAGGRIVLCFVQEGNSTKVVKVEANCFVALEDTKPLEINEGDIILFPPQ